MKCGFKSLTVKKKKISLALPRKNLVVQWSHCERIYTRTGVTNVSFFGEEQQPKK